MLGPGALLLASVVVLAAFCVVSGWLFAAGSRLWRQQHVSTTAVATGTVYLLEPIGSTFGGLLASIVLLRYCGPLQLAFLAPHVPFAGVLSRAV